MDAAARAAGQPPEQERVDRPERQVPVLGTGASARHGVQDVSDLRPAEVRVQGQARPLPEQRLVAGVPQALAGRRRDPALPDDRVGDRLAGRAIPDDRRLALVRDPDRGDPLGAADLLDDPPRDPELARPDPSGSCVTCPGEGKRCSNGSWAMATGRPSLSNAIARDEVVPWSSARIRARPRQAVLAAGGREVALDLVGLPGLVPAELRAEDRRDSRRDRSAPVGQLLGEAHPAGEDVVERQRELVARGPRDLALEVVDALAEGHREVELV